MDAPPDAGLGSLGPSDYVQVVAPHLSRPLYANPVCLLTSSGRAASSTEPAASDHVPARNVMTISWLTCTSNAGELVCSLKDSRCTAQLVRAAGDRFVLSVPVRGMEALVKAVGSCSGRKTDKFATLALPVCRPGAWPLDDPAHPDDALYDLVAIAGCCAHMVCVVTHALPDAVVAHHNILFCRIERCYVHRGYWAGATFAPTTAQLPPYLSFLGQGKFATVVPLGNI